MQRDESVAGRPSVHLLPSVRTAMEEAGFTRVSILQRAFNATRHAPEEARSYDDISSLVKGENCFDRETGGYTALAEDMADFLKKQASDVFGVMENSPRVHDVDFDRLPQEDRTAGLTQPEDYVLQREREEAVRKSLAQLPDRHAQVLSLRFGLNGEHPHTHAEIAQQLNVSISRIGQIEERAIRNLRKLIMESYTTRSKSDRWSFVRALHI